jgi:hypothetical protein
VTILCVLHVYMLLTRCSKLLGTYRNKFQVYYLLNCDSVYSEWTRLQSITTQKTEIFAGRHCRENVRSREINIPQLLVQTTVPPPRTHGIMAVLLLQCNVWNEWTHLSSATADRLSFLAHQLNAVSSRVTVVIRHSRTRSPTSEKCSWSWFSEAAIYRPRIGNP